MLFRSGRQGTDANIWAIRMSDVGLDAVLSLKELRELRFECTSVGVGIEETRFADVSYVSVTTGWVEKMKALPKLEKLKLQGCDRLNDDSIRALAALPGLRQVDLKDRKSVVSVTLAPCTFKRCSFLHPLMAAKPSSVTYSA